MLNASALKFVIMNKVYRSFGDFLKNSSFCAINTLDISNTDMAKAKMSRLEIVTVSSLAKINPRKICQNLDPQILSPKGNL